MTIDNHPPECMDVREIHPLHTQKQEAMSTFTSHSFYMVHEATAKHPLGAQYCAHLPGTLPHQTRNLECSSSLLLVTFRSHTMSKGCPEEVSVLTTYWPMAYHVVGGF